MPPAERQRDATPVGYTRQCTIDTLVELARLDRGVWVHRRRTHGDRTFVTAEARLAYRHGLDDPFVPTMVHGPIPYGAVKPQAK